MWISIALLCAGVAAPAPGPSTEHVVVELEAPSLARYVIDRRAAGADPSAAEQRSYLTALEVAQTILEARLGGLEPPPPVVWRFRRALNGLQVVIRSAEEREALRQLEGVARVRGTLKMTPALDDGAPHIGATALFEDYGLDGAGIDIGILDDGIDYLHDALGGPGDEALYALNDRTTIDDALEDGTPLFPNDKVVGGFDFIGDVPSDEGIPTPDPDPFPGPQDDPGEPWEDHGTHIAATAAGLETFNHPPGIAPKARLWALRIFSDGWSSMTTAGVDFAMDPNGDGDLTDALDVLNISIGAAWSGGGDDDNTAEAEAFDAFVALGGVVVASAGNRNDVPFITSAPAALPGVISVANSYGPAETGTYLIVSTPDAVAANYPARPASSSLAPTLFDTGTITGTLAFGGFGCAAGELPPEGAGSLALVHRGECKFVDKFAAMEEAGATALVVIQEEGLEPIKMTGAGEMAAIPGVMLAYADGVALQTALEAGEEVQAALGSGLLSAELTDTLKETTSRGPGFPFRAAEGGRLVLKPDLTAPGTHVEAAFAGTGSQLKSKTGTSMAAPHVAGLAALLKQANPGWSPAEIEARLVNTAYPEIYDGPNPEIYGDSEIAPLSRRGAGRVDGLRAVQSSLVAWSSPEVALDFGFRALSQPETLTRTVTVRHDGEAPASIAAEFQWTGTKGGVEVALSPQTLQLGPGEVGELNVELSIDPAALPAWALSADASDASALGDGAALSASEHEGRLLLSIEGGDETIQLPLWVLARPVGEPALLSACLDADPARVDLTNASEISSRAEVFTLLAEDPDEPDTWNGADVRALGLRAAPDPDGEGQELRLAVATWDWRLHPGRVTVAWFMDTSGDTTADFLVVTVDESYGQGEDLSGRTEAWLLASGDANGDGSTDVYAYTRGWDLVDRRYVTADALSGRLVVPCDLDALEPGVEGITMWVAVLEGSGALGDPTEALDVVPDGVVTGHIAYQDEALLWPAACAFWPGEAELELPPGDLGLSLEARPNCPVTEAGHVQPSGILVVTEAAPGLEAHVVPAPPGLTALTCPQAVALDPDPGMCGAALTAERLLGLEGSEGCQPALYTESLEPAELSGQGTAKLAVRDRWGQGLSCEIPVTVAEAAPSFECPAISLAWDELPATVPVGASHPCDVTLTLDEVRCDACEVRLEGQGLVVDSGVGLVEIDLTARAPGGTTATDTCLLDLGAPPAVTPDTGPDEPTVTPPTEEAGCAGGAPAESWALALALLALTLRRRSRGARARA